MAIIDASVVHGETTRRATIVVRGDRIVALRDPADPRPKSKRHVDGRGLYVTAGLWDMHAHHVETSFDALLVAHGVTGVRDMAGPFHQGAAWYRRIADLDRIGPRVVTPRAIVDGPRPLIDGSIAVDNPAAARAAVAKLAAEGAFFVKIYNTIPREAFFALADEARGRGIPFAGHVPLTVTATEASDAGQRSMDHLTGLLLDCSSEGETIRRQIMTAVSADSTRAAPLLFGAPPATLLDTYDDARAAALFERLARNETWQVPTLAVLWAITNQGDRSGDERLAFMPDHVVEHWQASATRASELSEADRANNRRFFDRYLALVKRMHEARVPLLAGTDMPNPHVYPGWSLHEELQLLVRAGLSPAEALKTATADAARFLDLGDDAGSVETGKVADLVVLEGNPLDDINNTTRIAAVVLRGRYLDRAALDRLLAGALQR